MLTQGPASDPKCKLIFSSFLTLKHLLDRLIFYQECHNHCIVVTYNGGWDRWGWFIYIRVGVGVDGWVSSHSFCFFLVLLYFVVSRSQSLYLDG